MCLLQHMNPMMQQKSSKEMKVNATIALEADDDILVARLLERGKSSGRSDDQDENKDGLAVGDADDQADAEMYLNLLPVCKT